MHAEWKGTLWPPTDWMSWEGKSKCQLLRIKHLTGASVAADWMHAKYFGHDQYAMGSAIYIFDFSSLESRFHKEEFGLVLGSVETALQNIPDHGQVWQLQYNHHVYEQARYQTQRQGSSYQSTCQTIAGDLVSVAQPTAADAQDDFDLPEVKLSD